MPKRHRAPLVLAVLSLSVGHTLGGDVQPQNLKLKLPAEANTHRQTVKDAFVNAYTDWQLYANGSDDLAPLSPGQGTNPRNGWGATTVDALGTMKIMGLDDLFTEAVQNISKVDFTRSHSGSYVSFFETVIRYLGGMLSAYELNGGVDQVLLDQSKILSEKLVHGWVGNNTLPWTTLDFTTDSPVFGGSSIAGVASNALEFYTLDKYIKNSTYTTLAERTLRQIAINPTRWPGLAPESVDVNTGQPAGDHITWGGGSDSYYEYLIKYGRLTNNQDPLWVHTWATAVDSSIKYLARNSSVGGWLYLTEFRNNQTRHISSHLACFHGGNWILGGKLMDNQTMVDMGLRLTDACVNTYLSTATGIGPEMFGYIADDGGSYVTQLPGRLSKQQQEFYDLHGFYLFSSDRYYILRPEVIESNFYAWRATGDVKYQQNAVKMMTAVLRQCKAKIGYASIWDVDNLASLPGSKDNDMESFFFAEVMKYLYLTFDDPDHISLDEWVFNTEAHPFRAPPPLRTYAIEPDLFAVDYTTPFYRAQRTAGAMRDVAACVAGVIIFFWIAMRI